MSIDSLHSRDAVLLWVDSSELLPFQHYHRHLKAYWFPALIWFAFRYEPERVDWQWQCCRWWRRCENWFSILQRSDSSRNARRHQVAGHCCEDTGVRIIGILERHTIQSYLSTLSTVRSGPNRTYGSWVRSYVRVDRTHIYGSAVQAWVDRTWGLDPGWTWSGPEKVHCSVSLLKLVVLMSHQSHRANIASALLHDNNCHPTMTSTMDEEGWIQGNGCVSPIPR